MTSTVKYPPFLYDEQYKRLTCLSYYDFLTTLSLIKTKGKDIDINGSIGISANSIKFVDGSYKYYHGWGEMFYNLEEDFGIGLELTSGRSYASRSIYILALKEDLKIVNEVPPGVVLKVTKIEDIQDVPVIVGIDNITDSMSISDPEPVVMETIPTEEEKKVPEYVEGEVDYDYFNSLFDENDVRGSKDELEKIVIKRHNIDLRKNQTFENMIEQLKEELDK